MFMDFDPRDLDTDMPSRHDLIVGVTEHSLQLLNALRIQRDPDVESTMMSFDTSDPSFVAPGFITRNIGSDSILTNFEIYSSINRLTKKSELALIASFDGPSRGEFHLNAVSPGVTYPDFTLLINGQEMPSTEPAAQFEINRFLASLIAKNKTGNYDQFDSMDVTNLTINDRLTNEISDLVPNVQVQATYYFGPTLSPTANFIAYTETDGACDYIEVNNEHHTKATLMAVSTMSREERQAMIHKDREVNAEFMMQVLDGVESYSIDVDGKSTQIELTNDLLITTRDFIDEQIAKVFVPEPETRASMDEVIDEASHMNIEDEKELGGTDKIDRTKQEPL